MSQDNKALQDLFDTVHYNEDLVDRSSDEDEIDPDDDEGQEKYFLQADLDPAPWRKRQAGKNICYT